MEETRILLSKQEASAALGVCVRTIDNLISEKRLPTIRIGRRVMIRRDALERFARYDQPTRGGK